MEEMELHHIVLFKFTNEAPTETIRAGAKKLESIPGVKRVEFGHNTKSFYDEYPDRSQGFTHMLVSVMESTEALREYGPHPLHQEFKQLILPYKKDILAMDFTAPVPASL
eukprot:CAMPEP_0119122586 /NCGR_PEP_ID=MMETSP1310-20130426/2804_1 /TAXON_ID=464262 /ORGANISM="Genus nov. species nov., Strain RCC2339" /LENGTH=109 /DNA_ID=CAMNT_0007112267 /DNA_START=62 /DNA_END=391 /DNA_ORIENTATION=-